MTSPYTSASELFGAHTALGTKDIAVKIAELRQSDPEVMSIGADFSPDGNRIAVESDGEKINIWDWRKNHIDLTVEKPRGASGTGVTAPVRFSPNGRLLAACDTKGAGNVVIRIWNTDHWTVTADIADSEPGGCEAVEFSPDGDFLIHIVNRGFQPSSLVVHAVGTWREEWQLPLELNPGAFAISPNGRFVAIAGMVTVTPKGDLTALNVKQIRHEPTICIVDLQRRQITNVIKSDAVGSLAWSRDGRQLAIAGRQFFEIFDSQSGKNLVHEELKQTAHMNVLYTPDGRFLLESDMNGRGTGTGVRIWDSRRQMLLQKIAGNIGNMAISRDGKYLALAGAGATTIWHLN